MYNKIARIAWACSGTRWSKETNVSPATATSLWGRFWPARVAAMVPAASSIIHLVWDGGEQGNAHSIPVQSW